MLREEAITKYIVPAIEKTWNDKRCKEILEALEQEPCEDWHDIPSGEMTLKQARQAVKELRKYVMDKIESCKMREATQKEREGVEQYIDSIEEPCEDCISRKEVLDYLNKMPSELTSDGRRMVRRRTLEEYISDTLPPVNPQQKTGHWIGIDEEPHEVWECDHCRFVIDGSGCIDPYDYRDTYKFCPNCGAKMEVSE